ncbi:MAG: hypothetical protein HY841_06185 [Bacteroidetes bacterium]|nr:hypothetical protein [Bacteroidota bacterium]
MEQTTTGPKRPTFLTVLCILTYVGVGLGIVMSVVAWWGMHAAQAMMDATSSMAEGMTEAAGTDMSSIPGMGDAMAEANAAIKWANVTLIVSIVGALLCLVGALQMWKLKKMGFFIYVVGELAPVIATAVLLGGSAFGGMSLVMGAVFPVLFVILYGLNLKHMS